MGEILYLGRGNTIDRQLKAENDAGVAVAQNLSNTGDDPLNVTKIQAIFQGDTNVTISSIDAASGAITWKQAGYATGEIRINPEAADEEDVEEGFYSLAIVVYMDDEHDAEDGIVWDDFGVHVKTV